MLLWTGLFRLLSKTSQYINFVLTLGQRQSCDHTITRPGFPQNYGDFTKVPDTF